MSNSAKQVGQPDMQVGCLLGFRKLLRILKKNGALVTTLARQFWTRCNPFLVYCEKVSHNNLTYYFPTPYMFEICVFGNSD